METSDLKPPLEILGLLAALLAFGGIVYPNDPFLLHVHPHPFWAVVILVSLRYAMPAGPAAGFLCGVLYLFARHREGLDLLEIFQLEVHLLLEPLLFVLTGFAIGETLHRAQRRHQALRAVLDRQQAELGDTEARRQALEEAYRKLERRVAGQSRTVVGIFETARRLFADREMEIYEGVADILRTHLEVERVSVWAVHPAHPPRLLLPEGETGSPPPFPGLGELALREGRTVSADEFYTRQTLRAEDGVMAGLVVDAEKEPAAVVVVESIPFLRFTRTAIRSLELVLQWASRSLQHTRLLRQARKHEVRDDALRLTSEVYVRNQGAQSLELARRRGQPMSLLLSRLAGKMDPGVRRRLRIVLARVHTAVTRKSDSAAYFEDLKAFVLLLPDVNRDGAEIVRRKIETALDAFDFRPYDDETSLRLAWGAAERHDDLDFDALLAEAAKTLAREAPAE